MDIYIPKDLILNEGCEDLIECGESNFKVHQCYESRKNTSELKCKLCGGSEFNVGVGSYYTAIRCVKCKYEKCIHQG